ncbi:MAG TPA: DUF4097 family beta strand repeat-containing protein [Permianibacter sp.]|nr:DUF4097 family beta strand repeat-containing protein [Permianibacter sp.]
MNKRIPSLIALALLPLLGSAAWAGEAVSKSLDADSKGEVSIEIVRGEVTVIGWDQNKVSVEGTRDDKSERFVFERQGNLIRIEDQVPNNLNRGEGTRITVKVPRGNNLRVDLVSADLKVNDVAGSSKLASVSGNLKLEKLGHEVDAESVSGDIELRGAGKDVAVATVSGNIYAHITADRLQAESISGDVRLRNEGVLKRGDFSSVSGDVSIESAITEDTDIELESVSGNLELIARGEVNARIEAETGPGGDIVNQLTNDAVEEAEFTGAESLDIKVGNGGGRIQASVVSGEIAFRKK